MTESTLLKLYPEQKNIALTENELATEFLDDSLIPAAGNPPLIFANLLTSLDGRIALADQSSQSGMTTPSSIRSDLDWTLFCYLQAHADVLLTHSGYLRSLKAKELGNILNVAGQQSEFTSFRARVELSAAPRVVVLTSSLDFDLNLLKSAQGLVTLLVTQKAQQERIKAFIAAGFNVVQTDDMHTVSAHTTVAYLHSISARNAYLQTGPAMLHDMLQYNLLHRLYMTQDLSIVGGDVFKTICEGTTLPRPTTMHLRALYLANTATSKQQMFMRFQTSQNDN